MTDQETNLHPKNNPNVNLKPNIVTGNIPDKAVTFKQLDENLQNRIEVDEANINKNTADIAKNTADIDDEASTRETADSQLREEVFQYVDNINIILKDKIAFNKIDIEKNTADIDKNTADIEKNTANIAKNTTDISKNTEDIGKNTTDISSLETRTKNLEDSKVNVNTGVFDPTSDDPASQKSVYNMPIQFENIIDKEGHKRFIEGNGDAATAVDGLTISYNKWSLSGSHIMFVLAGTFSNATVLLANIDLVSFTLPTWIVNKIIPIWGNNFIEEKNVYGYANDWTSQSISIVLLRKNDNKIYIRSTRAATFTADRNFRIQFDLLIDSE